MFVFVFQDFYDEQGVFSESFWPQSEPPQAMAFNPRGRVNKPLTPPPTTQAINNQVSASVKFTRGVLGSKINGLVSSVELKVRAFCITKVAFFMATYAELITWSRAGCGQSFSLKLAGHALIVLFTAFLKTVLYSLVGNMFYMCKLLSLTLLTSRIKPWVHLSFSLECACIQKKCINVFILDSNETPFVCMLELKTKWMQT